MAINQSILRNMSAQMPGQNQQVLTGLQEASRSQMQAELGKAFQGGAPMGVRQIQEMGVQAAAAQAAPILQTQEQGQKQAAQLGQLSVQQQQQDAQKRLQERQLGQQQQQRTLERQLTDFNREIKGRLIDDQMQFQKDELGRTFFNDRQLLDYKLATAKSNLDMRDFEQKMRQASTRKIQMLKAAQAKLTQELQQQFQAGEQEKNQALTMKLAEAKRKMEEKIAREQAAAKNRASMISAGGSLMGMGIAVLAAGSNPVTAGALMVGAAGGSAGANILEGLFS